MAAKGMSLHIGLNFVDPDEYEGWDGELSACEFDANDMLAIAKKKKLAPTRLLTKQATSKAVIAAISDAAKKLSSGDLFWLTYSGHGGQVPDVNGDDADGMDETWVLYDRMLVDDEMYALWSKFKPGVRILVFSDSCHSGTVTRRMPAWISGAARARSRLMPLKQNDRVYRAHKKQYDAIQKRVKPMEKTTVKCCVILVSGCQDNQLSLDGARNGLFTATFRKVWNGGAYKGSHRHLRDLIVAKMPRDQTPSYYVVGKPDLKFQAQTPLTI